MTVAEAVTKFERGEIALSVRQTSSEEAVLEVGAMPLVGTGSWIGELLRKEADEWDKVAAAFDEPTPSNKGTEWRRMAAHADEMHASLAQAKTLLCEKYEFEAAARLSELLKTSSPITPVSGPAKPGSL